MASACVAEDRLFVLGDRVVIRRMRYEYRSEAIAIWSDTPVVQYWPEFGAAGEEQIPVRWLLSHQAGLPVVETTGLDSWRRRGTLAELPDERAPVPDINV